ncbi:MAG: AbrB family transcriptional regulator [Desulfuromonadaceae bacterium]|nr:AbrB family transcriptional regulator [Desulfuromonadaceae bacterium]
MASSALNMGNIAKGLVISICGGLLFAFLRIPLPWMLGPLFATGGVSICGGGISATPGGRQAGQLIIGSALGQYFSPEITLQILAYGWAILGAGASTLLFAWLSGKLLQRISRIDGTTAFFASVPGGAAEMAILGERAGARFDRVALSHSLRVLLVVSTVPVILTWNGAIGTDAYEPLTRQISVTGLSLLLLMAMVGGMLCARLNIANSWLLGPLAVSFLLSINGFTLSAMPPVLIIIGQLLIGWSLGVRFEPDLRKESYRFLLGTMASALLSLLLSVLMGLGIAKVHGISMSTMALATAPGGISEMCVTAKILKLGVPLVTSFQVARIAILLILTLPLWRLVQAKAPSPGEW